MAGLQGRLTCRRNVNDLREAGQQQLQNLGPMVIVLRIMRRRGRKTDSSFPNIFAAIDLLQVFRSFLKCIKVSVQSEPKSGKAWHYKAVYRSLLVAANCKFWAK